MSELKILYKLTTRSRPSRWLETVDSITHNSRNDSDYFILTSIDNDDHTMHNYLVANQYDIRKKYAKAMVISGNSENKIDAINRDMNEISHWFKWDILVNISDDMLITSHRFEEVLRSVFSESLDLFLHLPDGYQNENMATMSIMGRAYYERFNYIYHPSYESVYCDNEALDVSRKLERYVYNGERLFVHNHPANIGNSVWDEQYARTEAQIVHTKDCLNYEARKNEGFPNIELSILICTMPSRKEKFEALVQKLKAQIDAQGHQNEVEIVSDDRLNITIGEKRNSLLQNSKGIYVCFVDDDDDVAPIYIEEMFKVVRSRKDCGSLKGVITEDGANPKVFEHSLKYKQYRNDLRDSEIVYERFPNHLNCIRSVIAKKFSFSPKNHSEDTDWATALHESKKLNFEHEITPIIYYYKYVRNK